MPLERKEIMLPPKLVQIPQPIFSSSISSSPILTTVASGLMVGALGGGLGGMTAGALLGKSLALKGAAIGAALFGIKGYSKGKELSTWLKSQT
jgi:hypothetical protein